MTKVKIQTQPATTSPLDLAQVETLVGRMAAVRNQERTVTAQMDELLTAIRRRYEPELLELTRQIETMHAAVQKWAETHPAQFAPRKSLELRHGTIGFRTGNPRLKTVGRRNWDTVLQALRDADWGRTYIRVKEEVNKEQLIADVGSRALRAEDLLRVGAQVTREESFFVDPNLTNVTDRQAASLAAA
jgi:phage host-nuclease inhibitor protein Gam